jgi:beta-fructofuranosidase
MSRDRALPLRIDYSGDPARSGFHFAAPTGWLNDPNGLIQWKGLFHLFYQFNPDGPFHANILWGHATSTDLVHWTDRPVALTPEAGGPDEDGCWSGVMVNDRGTPTIVYSGRANGRELPCIAVADDTLDTWTKDPGNPVIAAPPQGLELTAFRDHCVWQEGDGWFQLIGSGIRGRGGTALLYTSRDLRVWEYRGPILIGDSTETDPIWTGTMWECVDLFELDGRHVLVASVWDEGVTHHPIAFVGSYVDGTFTPDSLQHVDLGLRYCYAPQTFRDDAGRRIMIGWMQEGRTPEQLHAAGWAGLLTVPRVLSLSSSGRLLASPVPGLTALRGAVETVSGVLLEGEDPVRLADVRDGMADLMIEAEIAIGGALVVELFRSPEGDECTTLTVDRDARTLTLDRSASSAAGTDAVELGGAIELREGRLRLRILLDHSAIEIFANGTPLSARVYPTRDDATGLRLCAGKGRTEIITASAWEMRSASRPR